MLPLLLDEGLPPVVAHALRVLGLDAWAVGDGDAPARGVPDDENCKWCADHQAILVTNDQGRKDRAILDALAQHRVHALFVRNDLRADRPHALARALLSAEAAIDDRNGRRHGLIHHRLTPGGKLVGR